MIGKLKGVVDSIAEDYVIVDVGGVGYVALCSANTLRYMPAIGQPVSLAIETHVREDHIHLYGFMDAREREWFRILTTVQGVGNRIALAILGVLSPDDISQALLIQDKTAFTQVSGIGPKLAERIVTELKGKAVVTGEGAAFLAGGALQVQAHAKLAGQEQAGGATKDALSALTNLGYGRQEAFQAIQRVASAQGPDIKLADLIRLGLKELTHG